MRFTFAVMLSLYLTIPAVAEDFAKIWDGTSFLIPTVSTQPRRTVRTSLTGFSGYYDGTYLRNEDAIAFTQRFAPRWTQLQFGYSLALRDAEYIVGVRFELPVSLLRDKSLSTSPVLSVNSSFISYHPEEYSSVALTLPVCAQVWPRLKTSVSTGFGYRSTDTYRQKVHPPQYYPYGDCIHPNPEEVWVHPRGAMLEFTAHKYLNLSLEYARTTYYSIYEEWEYGKGYVKWTEVRESIAPGVRFTSGGWSLAAGFPFSLNGKTTAEGLIFNLAYQSAGKKR